MRHVCLGGCPFDLQAILFDSNSVHEEYDKNIVRNFDFDVQSSTCEKIEFFQHEMKEQKTHRIINEESGYSMPSYSTNGNVPSLDRGENRQDMF